MNTCRQYQNFILKILFFPYTQYNLNIIYSNQNLKDCILILSKLFLKFILENKVKFRNNFENKSRLLSSVNLSQTGIIWKEETQLRSCLHKTEQNGLLVLFCFCVCIHVLFLISVFWYYLSFLVLISFNLFLFSEREHKFEQVGKF